MHPVRLCHHSTNHSFPHLACADIDSGEATAQDHRDSDSLQTPSPPLESLAQLDLHIAAQQVSRPLFPRYSVCSVWVFQEYTTPVVLSGSVEALTEYLTALAPMGRRDVDFIVCCVWLTLCVCSIVLLCTTANIPADIPPVHHLPGHLTYTHALSHPLTSCCVMTGCA